ncbi:MAG: lipocalin family protein [Bdellovibrionales bacterium]|nr:lipocalin family protein [Bdellovibrionales bacterium]
MYVRKLFIILFLPLVACATTPDTEPPQVVETVDLNRYAGEWYEIATFPMIFQWGCGGAKATYKIIGENKLSVLNQCQGFFGVRDIEGVASVVDSSTPAKLEVDFGWGRKGEYWIIDLAQDYSYAVVGNSDKSSLWILYRKPKMPEDLYNKIIEELNIKGFNLSKLKKTTKPFR